LKNHAPKWSLRDRLRSFTFAFSGLKIVLKTQHNSWIHLAVTGVVLAAGVLLRISPIEWCLLTLAMASVWITETLNTAVEFLTDLVSPEFHPIAGQVKDLAAAAVLIAAVGAAVVGVIVFLPLVLQRM
jgi:diacylglycerol kinase (ATP)